MTAITGPYQQKAFPKAANSDFYNEKRPHGMQKYSYQQFTPEQMELYQSLFSHLGEDSYLSKLASGDQEAYAEMEAPALRQFNDVLGGIGSRFSGMGMGAKNSSGFKNTTTAAGANFAQELAANRMNMQRQATQDLMNYSNQLLGQRPMDRGFIQKPNKGPGFWETFGQAFAQQAGSSLANPKTYQASSWMPYGGMMSGAGGQ